MCADCDAMIPDEVIGGRMVVLEVGVDEMESIVAQAVAALAAGELVVMPTDTVYGLAARGDVEAAVGRVYEAKRRPPDRPLPVLVADAADLERYGRDVPEAARKLAAAFWPGPLTIVVPRSEAIPAWVTAGEETVGLRQPDHPLAIAILRAAAFPVAVTSANISGDATPWRAKDCAAALAVAPAVVVEAGPLSSKPSTVVKVEGEKVTVLRAGPIGVEQMREVLGPDVEVEQAE